jgi:hypothetical protein
MSTHLANISFEDYNGVEYSLKIYTLDTLAVYDVTFDNIGSFKMVWKGPDGDNMFGIYKHHIELSVLMETSTQENLLGWITTAKENKIYAILERDEVTVFFGFLLMDVVSRENKPMPYFLNLVFTDSLGKAGEVDYTTSLSLGLIENTYRSPARTLQTCLTDLKIDKITDEIALKVHSLRTINALFPDTIEYTGDPLNAVLLPSLGWYDGNDTEDQKVSSIKQPSVEDVLNEVCRCFHAIFYFSNGYYIFENLDSKLNPTNDAYEYGLVVGGVLDMLLVEDNPSTRLPIDHSDITIQEGGEITYSPLLRSIRCDYKLQDGNLLVGYLFDTAHYTTIQPISPVEIEFYDDELTPSTYFSLGAYYKNQVELKWLPENSIPILTLYRMTIKLNDKYLVKTFTGWDSDGNPIFGNPEWVNSAGYFYQFTFNEDIYTNYDNATPYLNDVLAVSNTIPEDGILELLIELVGLIYNDDGDIGMVETADAQILSWTNTHNFLSIYDDKLVTKKNVTYTVTNDADNLKKIEYDGIFLEYGNVNSRYCLRYLDGDWSEGYTIKSTDKFLLNNTGDAELLQILTLKSQVALRQTIRKQYQMTLNIHSNILPDPSLLIEYDGSPVNDNLITSIDFDAIRSRCDIELMQFEKGTDPTTATDTSGVDVRAIDEEPRSVNIGVDDNSTTNDDYIKTTAYTAASTAYTSRPITGMKDDWFEGDRFWIVLPDVTAEFKVSPLRLMLSADIADGDKTMSFFEVTTDKEYPLGSYVIPQDPPKWQVFRFDNVTAAFVTLPIDIPDETILSATAMERRINVYQQGVKMNYVTHGEAKPNYNDCSSEASTKKIHFQSALEGAQIIVEILWQKQR